MTDQDRINLLIAHVKEKFSGEASGHDWFHLERVWKMARHLAQIELTTTPAIHLDHFVLEAAALLHDIADWKFHGGDEQAGPAAATALLTPLNVEPDQITQICEIISTISFKGAGVSTPMTTLEGKLVQDADRLDAIGAIGVARAFAYGGSQGRLMYDPALKPEMHASFASYKTNQNHTINHFYEKLLLLKDRMNTASGTQVALQRHQYLETFLDEFLAEWNGQR